MSRKVLSILSLLVMITLLFSIGACAKTPTPTTTSAPVATTNASQSTSLQTTAQTTKKVTFEKPTSLTYWSVLDTRMVKFATSLATTPPFVELKKRLGVDITFIHPPQGMDKEQFKVLVASKQLPDIIEYDWFAQYPGGPAKAISDGVIKDLTPYFVPEVAPNIVKLLAKFDAEYGLSKAIKTIDGKFYVFPCIRGEGLLKQINNGTIIRKDWLDELGMKVPVTLDDWYTMLTRFKKEKGCTAPLTFKLQYFLDGQDFVGAYGVGHDFYVDTKGVIQYGPVMPEYKKFYETMAKWYAEGLISPDFSTLNDDGVLQSMTSGKSGACIGQNDATMGIILTAMSTKDPKFNLIGGPHPKLNANDPNVRIFKRDWFYTSSGSAAISVDCKNPAGAASVLDYWYGDEGTMLGNWGILGESYTLSSDGTPKFTDLVMKNPNGNTFKEMIVLYSRGAISAPVLRDVRVIDAQRFDTRISDATTTWGIVADRSAIVPRLSFTDAESSRLAKLVTDINTYNSEMFLKFIMGRTPVSEFDNSVNEMKRLGIEEVLTIYNTAFARYNKN